jgi:hypothetical protein
MNYRRGNKIILQNLDTGEKVPVTVVMHDGYQGWLAVNKEGDWLWYREKSNVEYGWPGPYYECIEKIPNKQKKRKKKSN